jgi:predicted CoA-substrate-specific enzyme activase
MSHFPQIGIDSGSRTTKLVVLDENGIVFRQVVPTGIRPADTAHEMLRQVMNQFPDTHFHVCSTGYGRNLLRDLGSIQTEIVCQARGVHRVFPEARSVIDIGGQDAKVIVLDGEGNVADFAMNDKCAAGTGRFLEMVALRLEIPVDRLGELSSASTHELDMDSTCAVFAESEVIGLLARGCQPGDIAAAVHRSVAKRIRHLASGIDLVAPIVFTGGVARNTGMVREIARAFGLEMLVPEDPDITAAIGAGSVVSIH